jgi:hypothetical protein
MEDLTPPDHVRPPTVAYASPQWAFCAVPSRLV